MTLKLTVAGMLQCGSTRLFNLLILLYENNNNTVHSCLNYEHDKDDEYDVIINKTHDADVSIRDKYDIILLPMRDIRDCAISARIRFKKDDIIENCLCNINLFNTLNEISDFVFIYEKYDFEYIKELIKFLNLNLSDDVINDVMMKLHTMHISLDIVKFSDHNDKMYKKTLYSQHHNTSNGLSKKYNTELDDELNKKILDNKIIFDFLSEHNYKCDIIMNNLVVVIMCGGSGSRLWPKSRSLLPKQFLNLVDTDLTMFQLNCQNVESLNPKKYLIICNENHIHLTEKQLDDLNIHNYEIISEPKGRDTCAAISVASNLCDENDNLVILTADHIWDKDNLCDCIKEGLQNQDCVTFIGIKPTYAETGYGYIHCENNKVISFKEKPRKDIAEEYFKNGHYLWNSGIFMFPNKIINKELNKHQKELNDGIILTIKNSEKKGKILKLNKEYFEKIQSISIDYAVMEKQENGKIISYNGYWCDIGSFEALYNHCDKDDNGNILSDDTLVFETKNCHIDSNKLVATIGIEDLIIIDDRDVLLIAKKDKTQMVKNVVKELEKRGRSEIICHAKVFRPWGWYINIEGNDNSGFKVKRIGVYPGKRLSLQSHNKRSEHWVITKGKAKVQVGMDFIELNINQHVYIPKETLHRMENIGEDIVEFIETQIGDYLGEDDIIRYEDDFGRV
jgi:mannose-1-phosphate guanylyltransferase